VAGGNAKARAKAWQATRRVAKCPPVQIYTKFKQPKPKRRSGNGTHWGWGLLLAVVCVGAWWWWRERQAPAPSPSPAPSAQLRAYSPGVTNAGLPVTVVTNPPRPAMGGNVLPVPGKSGGTATNRISASEPVFDSTTLPRPPQNTFEVQLALARAGISSGSFDGVIGSQTRAAIRAFQLREGLPETGVADAVTKARLQLTQPPLTNYLVTSNDLARLQPLSTTWLGKSQQSALDYESILELVAERGHAHPALIKRLNPTVDWTNVTAGVELRLPNISYPSPRTKAAFVLIHLAGKSLQAFDSNTNLLAHFPCSIAARVEKRPVGELSVVVVAPNPNYTFDPDVFPESAEARQIGRKLILPPGPNNPVGVAWIGLDRPGYGIHGTPAPEQVGRTESHGCFRLANWNAEYLLKLVTPGTPVRVVE
jgi:lipoprotein-anchoring transpeptidase ErfK/SrfK